MTIRERKRLFAELISKQPGKQKRGVVLLIVVSLLSLFILLGVTYMVTARLAYNTSRFVAANGQRGDAPETEVDLVVGQILYDTAARTVLQQHSLLNDLYGNDSISGSILSVGAQGQTQPGTSTPPFVVDGNQFAGNQNGNATGPLGPTPQFFSFQVNLPKDASGNINYFYYSAIPNYYAGRVITFTSGKAVNHSTRIVAYNPYHPGHPDPPQPPQQNEQYPQFTIEAIESKLAGSVQPAINDTFIINGAPFNGTGAGYDPITGNLDAVLANQLSVGQL